MKLKSLLFVNVNKKNNNQQANIQKMILIMWLNPNFLVSENFSKKMKHCGLLDTNYLKWRKEENKKDTLKIHIYLSGDQKQTRRLTIFLFGQYK